MMRVSELSDIRAILGREPVASETEVYSSMDEISLEAVAAKQPDHGMIISCKYLHERVPGSRLSIRKLEVEELTQRDRSRAAT